MDWFDVNFVALDHTESIEIYNEFYAMAKYRLAIFGLGYISTFYYGLGIEQGKRRT